MCYSREVSSAQGPSQSGSKDGSPSAMDTESTVTETESDVAEGSLANKKKKDPLYITDDQADDIIQWLKEHPCIYNKGLRDYRDTAKKSKLWQDKAKDLGLDPLRLQTWVDSMRSRFGRLTQTKSGQGAKEHTERETWILQKFSFFAAHIARQTSRHGVGVSPFYTYCISLTILNIDIAMWCHII